MRAQIGTVAAALVAVAFAWAGAAKLAATDRTKEGFAGLGLPAPGLLVVVVPLVELGVAIALLAMPALGGALALFLLVFFTVVLVRALARHVEVRCSCFGSASAEPVSELDVARNLGLAVLSATALVAPRSVAPGVAAALLVGGPAACGALALAGARRRRREASAREGV